MKVPSPRGVLSEALIEQLRGPRDLPSLAGVEPDHPDDEQLSLWLLYELHYDGLEGVDERLEWDPDLLRVTRRLEESLERRLRDRFPGYVWDPDVPFGTALLDYVAAHDGPALSPYVRSRASLAQVRELLRHRSLYHLREFDPTTWVIPRLPVAPKAALLELGYDEYGVGDPNRLHAHLFARGLAAAGLDPTPGAYLDEAPMEVLEQNNAMTLLGLHRRHRAAALGHLAAFEATSSLPSRRLARGLRRVGLPTEIVDYYLEHVTADAVHDQLAARSICGALVGAEPHLAEDVVFGAFTCLDLETRYAARMLDQWQGQVEETA